MAGSSWRAPSEEFEICFRGENPEDHVIEWYAIKVPDPEACPPPSYFSVNSVEQLSLAKYFAAFRTLSVLSWQYDFQ
jgi:hypothetical protein